MLSDVSLRSTSNTTLLTYKENKAETFGSALEWECAVDNHETMAAIIEKIGLLRFREQEKYRHAFMLDAVSIVIDTWPKIPPYVELEGASEQELRAMAHKLDLLWESHVTIDPLTVHETKYNIPLRTYRIYTFDKIS